jgi:hypothetical protein
MQIIRSLDHSAATVVSRGVRVLLLSGQGASSSMVQRLAALGGKVDIVDELFAAMAEVIDDPAGYGLLVIDCDSAAVGGLVAAQRAVQMLGDLVLRVPAILVSSECRTQTFPEDRAVPTVLRAPLSAVSLKVGFEHALRERLMYKAA